MVGALVASLSAPLFDGGALQAQVRAQQAALALAHATWRATLLQALQDVEDALSALRGDRQRLASLLQAADAGTRAATLARQRYGSGLVDFQTVLETQRNQLTAQDGVAAAQADIAADQVRLFRPWAVAGTPTTTTSTPPPTPHASPDAAMNAPTPPAALQAPANPAAPATEAAPTEIATLLGSDQPKAWYRRPLTRIVALLLLAAAGGLWWWWPAARRVRRTTGNS